MKIRSFALLAELKDNQSIASLNFNSVSFKLSEPISPISFLKCILFSLKKVTNHYLEIIKSKTDVQFVVYYIKSGLHFFQFSDDSNV